MSGRDDPDLIAGRHFHDLRRWDLAERHLRAGLAREPQSAADQAYLARALIRLERRFDARFVSDESLRLDPTSPEVLAARVDVLDGVGDRGGAVEAARVLAARLPESASARATLAFALCRRGRPRAALQVADQALALDPTDTSALNAKAVALGALLRPREAEATLRAALELAPESPALHNNMGLALLSQGRVSMARGSMEEALRLDAESRFMARNLRRFSHPVLAAGAILLGGFIRGLDRWGRWPAGIQVGLIVGLLFGGIAWTGLPAAGLLVLLWSLVGWIQRVAPKASARIGRAMERIPGGMVSLPVIGLYWVFHLVRLGGPIAGIGALLGFLMPLVLGLPSPDGEPDPSSGGESRPIVDYPGRLIRRRSSIVGGALVAIGGTAGVVGVVLPWVRVEPPDAPPYDIQGLGGSLGVAVAVLAFVVLLTGLARVPTTGPAGWRRGGAIAGGCAMIALGAPAVWLSLQWLVADDGPTDVSLGPGLPLIFVAGAFAIIGGFVGGPSDRRSRPMVAGRTTVLGTEVGTG